ncbi:hypothetical protein [Caulobacter sp. NIBR1757]|uniref:hypothetical protein n=1 Tax=Caulobacter sp. NIBR1757 TaxID=3016000 RepID=UPI0022F0820C|nr:hypothetical protein [Caulobacter sp. NIBR1757]
MKRPSRNCVARASTDLSRDQLIPSSMAQAGRLVQFVLREFLQLNEFMQSPLVVSVQIWEFVVVTPSPPAIMK